MMVMVHHLERRFFHGFLCQKMLLNIIVKYFLVCYNLNVISLDVLHF